MVLPVLHALQGHPEAGRCWERHINQILLGSDLGFVTTTHDKTIYTTLFQGQKVILLRQVDDFELACPSEEVAKTIFDIIGNKLQVSTEIKPPIKYLGLSTYFNGVDVHQYSNAIVINAKSYIQAMLKHHQWETPGNRESTSTKPVAPLPTESLNAIYDHAGPVEYSVDHQALQETHGFGYRPLLGELMYPYVTCRPDIGYAVTTLSKFSTCPHDNHFILLKGVAKYLRRTMDWGIVFRKNKIDPPLPPYTIRQYITIHHRYSISY
jgi:Reverse transcriptase (RNA-dependent DNA polymerase)